MDGWEDADVGDERYVVGKLKLVYVTSSQPLSLRSLTWDHVVGKLKVSLRGLLSSPGGRSARHREDSGLHYKQAWALRRTIFSRRVSRTVRGSVTDCDRTEVSGAVAQYLGRRGTRLGWRAETPRAARSLPGRSVWKPKTQRTVGPPKPPWPRRHTGYIKLPRDSPHGSGGMTESPGASTGGAKQPCPSPKRARATVYG